MQHVRDHSVSMVGNAGLDLHRLEGLVWPQLPHNNYIVCGRGFSLRPRLSIITTTRPCG